jgi:hypothetical protein
MVSGVHVTCSSFEKDRVTTDLYEETDSEPGVRLSKALWDRATAVAPSARTFARDMLL